VCPALEDEALRVRTEHQVGRYRYVTSACEDRLGLLDYCTEDRLVATSSGAGD